MNEYENKVMEIADELTRKSKCKWCGIDRIAYIDNGVSDAEIIYKGITLKEPIVGDYFWENFIDEYNENDYPWDEYNKMFEEYMRDHVYEIEDLILYDCEWNIKDIEEFILDNCKNGSQIERFIKNHLSDNVINDIIKEYNLQKTDELVESLQEFFLDYDYDFEDESFSAAWWEIEEYLIREEFLPEDYEEVA